MRRVAGQLTLLVVLAVTGPYGAAGAAEAMARLREVYPAANAVVDSHTVVSGALDYSIPANEFSPKTYFVHLLFNGPDGKTFNLSKRIEDGVELREQAGTALLQYPLKRVLKDAYLVKPVTIRFAVLKRINRDDSKIVAETEPVTYRLEP